MKIYTDEHFLSYGILLHDHSAALHWSVNAMHWSVSKTQTFAKFNVHTCIYVDGAGQLDNGTVSLF